MKRRGPSLVCSEGCEEYTGQPTIPNRREKPFFHHKCLKRMAGTTGLEPAASAVTGQRSNQLNYVPGFYRITSGGQCRARTCDLLLVRQAL